MTASRDDSALRQSCLLKENLPQLKEPFTHCFAITIYVPASKLEAPAPLTHPYFPGDSPWPGVAVYGYASSYLLLVFSRGVERGYFDLEKSHSCNSNPNLSPSPSSLGPGGRDTLTD